MAMCIEGTSFNMLKCIGNQVFIRGCFREVTPLYSDQYKQFSMFCCDYFIFPQHNRYMLYYSNHCSIWLTVFLFCARAFIAGVYQTVYIYTPEVYPTKVRGLALGAMTSVARVGALVTPFVAQVNDMLYFVYVYVFL